MTESRLTFEERFKNWSLDHPRLWHVENDTSGIINFISAQTDRITGAQIKAANSIIVSQERMVSEIDRVAVGVDRVAEGLESLAATFEWGFSELVWHLEEQRKVLQDMLLVLQAPLDTQAKELKKRAERAYRNGWFEEALEDFTESEKKNRYDFTIHQNLGNIYLFEKRNPTKALEYYEKAAKYAAPESPYHTTIAFLHIGLIKYLQGDFREAYEATSKALGMAPHLDEAHYQHAQYCANLGKYSEAIEHLKTAIEGDRYYCVKTDSERDFNVMKKQLVTLFEELRREACDQAEIETRRARTSVQKCKAYGVPRQVLGIAGNKQSEANALYERGSYFDCLDACRKAREARSFILDSAIKYLSGRISEARQERSKKVQGCKDRAESNVEMISNVLMLSFVVFPIFPVVFGVLLALFTKNIAGAFYAGFLAWSFAVLLAAFCYLTNLPRRLLYRRYIGESTESYESELAILEKNLREAQKDSTHT
jgi:tetratricopeptide (TPR) repeat protein